MFWRRILVTKFRIHRRILLQNTTIEQKCGFFKNYSGLSSNHTVHNCISRTVKDSNLIHPSMCARCRIQYSKGLLDGDVTEFRNIQQEKDLKKITDLFPNARMTLNILTAKTPDKIFDIYYKQNVSAPKGVRKKAKAVHNDWTCTYAFVWPEKMKFEGTAISKSQAAEKAAILALNYLYLNKHINNQGLPIYNQDVIDKLKSQIHEPIKASISDKSMERIERIWTEYQDSIKDIFEKTFKEAKHKIVSPAVVTKDSTIDQEDEIGANNTEAEVMDLSELKFRVHPVYGMNIKPPSEATLQRRDKALNMKFSRYFEELPPLPIDQYADKITSTLENNRVAVIVGAAGCGKSTRAPPAILKHFGAKTAAIVSEPRRVAAIDLAQTVSRDLGETVGESVGFQVRLQAKPPRPPAGSILYCTSGVLLRRLQANPGLEGCTHVFIDEAHERDVNTDVTLLLLKRALDLNPLLKVVIMSATLDIDVFTRYFNSCPVIEVPGRAFPVSVTYLDEIQKQFNIRLSQTLDSVRREDGRPQIYCQEVVEVIKAVDRTQPEGAILVFLPGWAEIKQTKQLLDEMCPDSTHMILPVHSRLSTADQSKMFTKPLPGVRKIVLATNIAETSITIPDVVYVIDTGAHKENRIKDTGTASLETVWVSQAGAKQRTGRAGRVRPGHCYRLYTKEKEAEFATHTTPEILRIPLVQTVLDCKSYAPEDKVENFLSQLPEPPSHKAIQLAVDDLIDLGALTPSEHLTRLGSTLSMLPLHPRLGAVLLHAAIAGNVVCAANAVTHCADNVEIFENASERRQEIREIKCKYSTTSDHAALHWIQDEFERELDARGWKNVDEWCSRYGLRKDRLNYVKSISNLHLEQILKSGVFECTVEAEELNRFSDIEELMAGILLSGANSLLRTKRSVRTKGKLKTAVDLITSTGDRAHIGSESVNSGITKQTDSTLLAYFGGYHSTERRALVVYKTSRIPPHTAILFSKGDVAKERIDENEDTTILSLPRHKLKVHMPTNQAEHILKAREMLWNTFQYYIERNLEDLDYDENTMISRFKVRLMKTVGRVLVESEKSKDQINVDNVT